MDSSRTVSQRRACFAQGSFGAPSRCIVKPAVTVPVWLHWVGITTVIAGSTVFVSRIDPTPGVNLALHAKVTTSSNDGTLASSEGAVDGDIWNVGFRTDWEVNPWILLDLGSEKTLSGLVVYSCYDRYPYPAIRPQLEVSRDAYEAILRFDCREQDEIPLRVELSRDGRTFSEVARQDSRFEMWVKPFAQQSARYVRLGLLRIGRLQLREIEVY
jgi:hypothetical protein